MKVPSLLAEPWALSREAFDDLVAIAVRNVQNARSAKETLNARLVLLADDEEPSLDVREGGVAVIPVRGYLTRRSYWRGDRASYQWIGEQLAAALEREDVRSIVLEVDTAGGQVNGCEELASRIYEGRQVKPIRSVVLGRASSAGYWIASSAELVHVGRTSLVGSIGVIWTFIDYSKLDAELGIREIDIVSSQSPDKNLDPKTARGRARVQATVDQLAGIFVSDIARNRDVSEETVVADFGRGWVLVGEEARSTGMADRVATFDDAITEAAQADPTESTETPTSGLGGCMQTVNVNEITADWLSQNCPEVARELREAGASAARTELEARHAQTVEAARAEASEASATTERERILGIQAHAYEGCESVIEACIADPSVTPDAAAGRVMAHLRTQGSNALERLRETEPPNPPDPSAEQDDDDVAASVKSAGDYVQKAGLIR